jgi:hypothetical protein
MGRLWDSFQDKFTEMFSKPVLEKKDEVSEPEQKPMRAWRNEKLNERQRRDLIDTVNSPGYDVLQDLQEYTMEGFITYLVELPPEDEEKILAYHKLVHALYLTRKSIDQQVQAYQLIEEDDRRETEEVKQLLIGKMRSDPLENYDALAKLLDPTHQPEPLGLSHKIVVPKRRSEPETPLDVMLSERK